MNAYSAWDEKKIGTLLELPFFDLIHRAYTQHQKNFDATQMEMCTLLSIKTGRCPEDCAYCPQSAHYDTGLEREKLLDVELVIARAKAAKAHGAKRFCMGAAWRNPPKKDFPKVLDMIRKVKALGLETCVTLGMLDKGNAQELKKAGLDYYNHNLDSSPEYYKKIITTRTYQQRIDTLSHVAQADINVCCGGILGMGESRTDRIRLLLELGSLPKPPQSIPINYLIKVKGTPLANVESIDIFEFARTIAVTRLMFPTSMIRLSAGRENMTDEAQAWCFMAGANSIFMGEKLLTASNPHQQTDYSLLNTLGFKLPDKIKTPDRANETS